MNINANVKPDWKDAPEWAMWLAQDAYGAWGWYEKKPVVLDSAFACWDIEGNDDKWTRPHNCDWNEEFIENESWTETLESRPEN